MNVLVLYDNCSTFTNTVLDHLLSFAEYSRHRHYYCHGRVSHPKVNWPKFDVLLIHYSLRVALGQVPDRLYASIREFSGRKILFVQDEYDFTENLRRAIDDLGINVVFTCVPDAHRDEVYPLARFPNVEFVHTLTGYEPLEHETGFEILPISQRPLAVGYRGRALPYYYGDLGQEKLKIAQGMRDICSERSIPCDIEWDDAHRIYGENWPRFLASAKVTLGTESGSNVFDDNGKIRSATDAYLRDHPNASYTEVRMAIFGNKPEKRIMNQISPRFFEAIAFRTGLVLFEGEYSGILQPHTHYIPLRKDFSNIDRVMEKIEDNQYIQSMVDRTYSDIIDSGRYSYKQFISGYDNVLDGLGCGRKVGDVGNSLGAMVTIAPERARAQTQLPGWMVRLWHVLPLSLRKRYAYVATRLFERFL